MSSLQWQYRVQARNGILESLLEHNFIVALSLGVVPIGADVLLTFDVVIERTQLVQQRLLHSGL